MKPLDERTFDAALDSATPTLVEFTAAWCPPCQALLPVLEALSKDRSDVAVCAVDVDDHPELAARFGVRSMPTLLLFRGGAPVGQLVGAHGRARLDAWLDDHLRS